MKNNSLVELTAPLPSIRTPISHLRQRITTAITVFLLTPGAFVMATPIARADGCYYGLCGEVKNRTDQTMSITEDLGEGPHYCQVWNWNGGTDDSSVRGHCTQETIGYGTYGGDFTGVDVDAFTFANEGYHERFGRLGTWHWRTKGVWTKIRDEEIADCGIGDGGQIWCTVLLQ